MTMNWTEWIGLLVTVMAVGGVLLNNKMDRNCFWLWMISNLISAGIHIYVGVWSLAVRDIIFFILAVIGLRKWTRIQNKTRREKKITSKLLDQNMQLTKLLNSYRTRFKC